MSIAFVTSIYGDYDKLKSISGPEDVEFICFSDKDVRAEGWKTLVTGSLMDNPRMDAKRFKLTTHRYLEHDIFVWVDGSMRVNDVAGIVNFINQDMFLQLAMFKHPIRDCIYEEAVVSKLMPKYQGTPIKEQVEHYWMQGHPKHAGLYAAGFFIRENTFHINRMFEQWMEENERWSYQDQLSLPVVLREAEISVQELPGSLYENDWFSIEPHVDDNK